MARAEGDVLESEYEMIRVQRKRAPDSTTQADGAVAVDAQRASGGDLWHAVDTAESSNDDSAGDSDDEARKKSKNTNKRMGRRTTASVRGGCLRRTVGVCASAQMLVALGVVWCSILAMMMLKWLWFYQGVVQPFEKWLGSKMRREGEPVIVGILIVVPFVASGLVFYLFRPWSPRVNASELPPIVEKLRGWRRSVCGSRVDSVDVAVIFVFALVQANTLVGKLLIDQYNGKLAKSGYFERSGRALGMNGFYAVLLSIVLVARRSFVHEFLNLSSERAAKYHVWCGKFGALSLTAHGVVYIYTWYVKGKLAQSLIPCFNCERVRAFKSLRNFSGLVAQVMLIAVAFASLERVRRRHFRRFTLVHCLNVLFVVGTCVHYYPAVYWFVAPMVVYIMYRIMSVFTRARSSVVRARTLDDAIVQLELRREGVGLDKIGFLPGQYVYIKVDEISKNEWHPITISSSPLRDSSTLMLDIKVQGPFTMRLLHAVRSGSLSSVQLDGYYGTGIETSSNMVFVAGGSGMTPFLSVLEHLLLLSQQERHAETLPTRLWIVWTARDVSLLNAHKPMLNRIRASSRWEARVWLHWTGSGDMEDENALEGVTSSENAEKMQQQLDYVPRSSPVVSHAVVFSGTVMGATVGMILVLNSATLSDVWWVKCVSLLAAGVLGAMAGTTSVLWRSLPTRTGFERVETQELDLGVGSTKLGLPVVHEATGGSSVLPSVTISRSRPDIGAILREVHAASRTDCDDVRVLVSGPSELQQRASDASVGFRSPLLTVESRSFAI